MLTRYNQVEEIAPPVRRRPAATVLRSRRSASRAAPIASPVEAPNPYIVFARRWWWLLLTGLVLSVIATVAYVRYGPVPHTSTALLMLAPQPQGNTPFGAATNPIGSTNVARSVGDTLSAQLSSPYLHQLVVRALEGKISLTPQQFAGMRQDRDIQVRGLKGTNIISVTVAHPLPDYARVLADTLAAVFIEDINTRSSGALKATRAQLEQQIATTREQLITAELQQRQQGLTRDVRNNRGQLLQVQLQYQLELQRQLEMERLALAVEQPRLTAQQRQRLQQVNDASSQLQTQSLQVMSAQQREVDRAIADLEGQLARVRDATRKLSEDPNAPTSPEQILASQLDREQRSLLEQREQTLVRDLEGQRNLSRQLQLQLQEATQRKISLDQQSQAAEASARAQTQSLQIMTAQQKDSEGAIADLERQLAQVRQSLSRISATTQDPAQQQERDRLQQREQGLIESLSHQRGQLRQLQLQYQEAKQREISLEQQAQAAKTSAQGQSEAVQAITNQQQEAERTISSFESQLAPLREALGRAPVDPDAPVEQAVASQLKQREQDLARQHAREQRSLLEQREQALVRDLEGQRNLSRQLQLQLQEARQKQAESSRQQVLGDSSEQSSQRPALPQSSELSQVSAEVRSTWLTAMSEQRQDLEKTIEDLNKQLDQVREELEKRPSSLDPTVSAAFATAYAQQLQGLTQDFARLQMYENAAPSVLTKYGEASDPVREAGLKKILPLSAAGGLAGAAGLGYLWELVQRRRTRREGRVPFTVAPASVREAGPSRLRSTGATDGEILDAQGDAVPARLSRSVDDEAEPFPTQPESRRVDASGDHRGV